MNRELIIESVKAKNFRARDREVEKITNAVLDMMDMDRETFVSDDIKVERWMDSRSFRPVYVVCRDYSGSSYPLMLNFKPLIFDLRYDACGAALMFADEQ